VFDYLIENGIASDRVVSRGFGESKPVASNDTPEGREQNRRVEFKILTE
jgi:outer membrane protein OmpA-like peptidoglycan-associated protein